MGASAERFLDFDTTARAFLACYVAYNVYNVYLAIVLRCFHSLQRCKATRFPGNSARPPYGF